MGTFIGIVVVIGFIVYLVNRTPKPPTTIGLGRRSSDGTNSSGTQSPQA